MIFRVVIIHKTIFKVGSVKIVAELAVNRTRPSRQMAKVNLYHVT